MARVQESVDVDREAGVITAGPTPGRGAGA